MVKVLGPLGILVLLAIGFFFLASGGRDEVRGLDASPIGTEGLELALDRLGIKAVTATPGSSIAADAFDLRIVPLYDMDLDDDRPETVGDTTLRTMEYWQFYQKTYSRALIVLPKWRWAAVEKGIAAPETAIPLQDYIKLMSQLNLNGLRLLRAEPSFQPGTAGLMRGETLFMAQRFRLATLPEDCRALISDTFGALVIGCGGEEDEILYLADPDVLNNHGLTLGDNAQTLGPLMAALRGDPTKPVYIDPLPNDYTVRDGGQGQSYERTSDDLWRFFKPPLGEIWAMLSILLALFLWRGGRRFGPVRPEEDEGIERSRREAVQTRARLIRLTGQDAAMVADYVRSDLARMTEAAFGRGRGDVGRLWPLLARRDGASAAAFQGLAQDLMRATPQSPAVLRRQLDTYHQLQRTLTHGADA